MCLIRFKHMLQHPPLPLCLSLVDVRINTPGVVGAKVTLAGKDADVAGMPSERLCTIQARVCVLNFFSKGTS